VIVQHEGAITHLHLTRREAGELASAITTARPQGSATTTSGTISVHVHPSADADAIAGAS